MHGDSAIGLLTRSALVQAMLTQGPDAYVSGAMSRATSREWRRICRSPTRCSNSAGSGACVLVMQTTKIG